MQEGLGVRASSEAKGGAATGAKGNQAFVAVARIVRPQGRRGEVAAEILTDFPVRFASLKRAFLERPGGAADEVELENTWPHKGRIILKFAGVDSIEQANGLRGRHVLIRRDERIELAEHGYYVWELEGCRVVVEGDCAETVIGTVRAVEPTGGTDVLHVVRDDDNNREILIPFAQEICKRIDTTAKRIVIDPPEGLLNLNSGE